MNSALSSHTVILLNSCLDISFKKILLMGQDFSSGTLCMCACNLMVAQHSSFRGMTQKHSESQHPTLFTEVVCVIHYYNAYVPNLTEYMRSYSGDKKT